MKFVLNRSIDCLGGIQALNRNPGFVAARAHLACLFVPEHPEIERECPLNFRGFVPFDRNAADLEWSIIGNDQRSRLQVLQENLTPELFYASELISALLHKARQSPDFLRMTIAVEQTNFLCNVVHTFQFGADVNTEKQVFFFIARGRATEYERLLGLTCASIPVVFLLWSNRDRMCTKIEVKFIGHVCSRNPFTCAAVFSGCQRRIPNPHKVFPPPLQWRVR